MGLALIILVGLVAAFSTFMCARNAYVGLSSGTVMVRSARYSRSESPTYFLIGVVLSAVTALLMLGILIAVAYVLLSSGFVRG